MGDVLDNVIFISDIHLGADSRYTSAERERRVCTWLRKQADDLTHLYLLGDVYDHWYEWGEVVPKGYLRWHGLLAELVDAGIIVQIHVGNHDLWQYGYLQDYLGVQVHREPQTVTHNGYQVLMAHGDGLGPGDRGYKLFKKLMTNRSAQWLLSRLHPNLTMKILRAASHTSREHGDDESHWLGREREWLVQYCESVISAEHYDYLVFGHRHLPVVHELSNGVSTYINLGDWLDYESYGRLTSEGLQLRFVDPSRSKVYG